MAVKRNLTLALEEELLVKARVLAARRRTSLTNLVRRSLEEMVSGDQLQSEALARLKARMSKPTLQPKPTRWTRDELHERSDFR